MQLDSKDLRSLVKLQLSLMSFVSQKLEVISQRVADKDQFSALPLKSRLKVRDAFLKHPGLIQDFVNENPDHYSREGLDIVLSWRHLVHGKFYALRELKNFTVFLSSQTPPVAYGVLALSQPFEELIGPHLPVMVKTILLPFKGRIVYDGLMSAFNVVFGPGVRRSLNEEFQAAKARHGIVTSLPMSDAPISGKTPKATPVRSRAQGKTSRRIRTPHRPDIEGVYPAVARFVRNHGHVEIGSQEGFGFVARALDYGGLVFESSKARTLAQAMAALERALADHLEP